MIKKISVDSTLTQEEKKEQKQKLITSKISISKYRNRINEFKTAANRSNRSTAYMNLNKRGGGASTTAKELIEAVKRNGDALFIKREIELINPSLVVVFGKNTQAAYDYIADKMVKGLPPYEPIPHLSWWGAKNKIKEIAAKIGNESN